MKVMLGCTYKDDISGFQGVATGIARYITGCDQVCLLPKMTGEEFKEARWFDVNRVSLIRDEPIILVRPEPDETSGGPQDSPPAR